MNPPIVIALGGNALLGKGEAPTFANQIRNVIKTARSLAKTLSSADAGFIITHGNGPQVGDELLRNEFAKAKVPQLPLHVLNAETQSVIGSMLELALRNEFAKMGIRKQVCTIITHSIVDISDPAFKKPTKPVGPFYTKTQLDAELSMQKFDYVKEDDSYRRVVPSPNPIRILEQDEIKCLADSGYIVICCGGGGVPICEKNGELRGADAVIDKDRTTQLLASSLGSKRMVILTNVEGVYSDYKKRDLMKRAQARELKKRLSDFEDGTIRPKLESCISFIENGGEWSAIGSLYELEGIMKGESGTVIS